MEFSHKSVLLDETVDALSIKPDGIYVDCTCGGAGHSSEILKRLSEKGRLIAIDQDPDAIEIIKERIGGDSRVTVVHDNFSNLRKILDSLEIDKVDGVLADLGVSSHQLDTAERGFSFHNEAPLDMRMSQEGMSAADIIATYSQRELTKIFRDYGEEKFAQRIAANIVAYRGNFSLSFLSLSAIPQFGLLSHFSSFRLFSGHSGLLLTLSMQLSPPLLADGRYEHLGYFSTGGCV